METVHAPDVPAVSVDPPAGADACLDRRAEVRSDALLAVRCQLGERSAFDDLIRRWAVPLRRFVGRVAGDRDAADELMQDIWLRVVEGIGRLEDPAKLRPWLFGIAHRRLMDRMRQAYSAPPGDPVGIDAMADESLALERDLEARDLERGLGHLPPVEREVLSLFYLEGLSLADVAETLDIPRGTVKSRLFRARNMLRHQLTGASHA